MSGQAGFAAHKLLVGYCTSVLSLNSECIFDKFHFIIKKMIAKCANFGM